MEVAAVAASAASLNVPVVKAEVNVFIESLKTLGDENDDDDDDGPEADTGTETEVTVVALEVSAITDDDAAEDAAADDDSAIK